MIGDVIEATLGGAKASLATSHAEFADYAALHLAPLRAEGRQLSPPDVTATLRWHEGIPPRERLAAYPELTGLRRLDRDLYAGDGCLAWFRVDDLPGLLLRFAWDGARLEVKGDYYHWLSRDPLRDRIKRLVYRRRLPALRLRRFTTLLYYLVYYPCFWWLEQQQGLHPIHAAAAEVKEGVIVLAGPSGVGKSTLATALAALPGAKLLSDTFVLQRGTTVLPVREPLLLSGWSRDWLGEAGRLLQPIRWRYCLDRAGFHWPQDGLSSGGAARVLLFPQPAAAHDVRALTPREAHGRISAADSIVNDLRRYWAYAAVLQAFSSRPLMQARENEIAALTAGTPSYEVSLDVELGRDEVVANLLQLSRGAKSLRGDESPSPAGA